MYKKEFRSLVAPVLVRLAVLLIPLFLVIYKWLRTGEISHFSGIMKAMGIGLAIITLWVANHLGAQAFKPEYRDHALEYLLSFPYSRRGLLALKLVPRLSVLAALVLLYEVGVLFWITGKEAQIFLFDPLLFPLWVGCFFFTGFFLSFIEPVNVRALANFALFIFLFVISLGAGALLKWTGLSEGIIADGIGLLIAFALILVSMAVSFLLLSKKLDLRFYSHGIKKYLVSFLVPIMVCAFLSIWLITIRGL